MLVAATPSRPGVVDGAPAAGGAAAVRVAAAAEPQTIGYVREAEGGAVIIRLNGPQLAAEAGTRLEEGDIVATQGGAKLELQFVDGTGIFLSGPARMLVQQFLFDVGGRSAGTFFVIEGVFAVSAGAVGIPGKGQLSVRTPVATVTVQGGRLVGKAAAETEQNTFTLVQNLDGTVGAMAVATSGATVTLNLANQTTRVVSLFRPPEKPTVLSLNQIEPYFGVPVLVWLAVYPNQQQALKELVAMDLAAIAPSAGIDGAAKAAAAGLAGVSAAAGSANAGSPIPDLRTRTDDALFGAGLFNKVVAAARDLLLVGDAGANTLIGGVGNDVLRGDAGDDVLEGGDGDDVLDGGSGNDIMRGGAGNDLLIGGSGEGDDLLDGGDGIDTVTFVSQDAAHPIVVDLSDPANGFASGSAIGTDVLIDIENVIGGAGGDSITGSDADNVLEGRAGDDVLDGRGGDDVFDGGAGVDTASFAAGTAPLIASLITGLASGADSGNDVLISIENLVGGGGDDVLTGDPGANVLVGGNGDDVLEGRDGADTLLGGDGDDLLVGGPGADVLNGGGGADRFFFAAPGEGGDQLIGFVSGVDSIVLLSAAFGGGASVNGSNFSVIAGTYAGDGTSNASTNDLPSFVFDGDGRLIFDSDGNAAGDPGFTIATVTGGPVAAADIQIVPTAPA